MIDLTQFEGHTPGPWAVYPKDFQIIVDTRGYIVACAVKDWMVPNILQSVEINSRLLAAAPDLLAELKAARAEVSRLTAIVSRPDIAAVLRGEAVVVPKTWHEMCEEFENIVCTYLEQKENGHVDTPGGLEHMGDV